MEQDKEKHVSLHEIQQYASGAIYVPADAGRVRWVAGDDYNIKVGGDETNGGLSFIVATVPPGGGPPAHLHKGNEESFYLLDGELEFLDGERTFVASAGDFVFVPRGVRHRFKNVGSDPAKMVFLWTPSGPEQVFLEFGDEPVPGQSPQPWTVDTFKRGMVELNEKLGGLVLPE